MPEHNGSILIKQILILFVLILSGCSLQCSDDLLQAPDLSPPVLLEIRPAEGPEVRIVFNEEVFPDTDSVLMESGETAALRVEEENTIILSPASDLTPGRQYRAALTVEDANGNSCRFILPFWGWNPEVPDLLINEFNPEGSGNNPDCIELYARKGGNCAGVSLYYGTRQHYEYRYVLPALVLEDGDYLIIHCRREYTPDELSETDDRTLSTGKLSSDEAWDLWLPEDRGLSGANGIISIYNAPDGRMLDGVVYSERSSDLEDDRLGWTSRTFDAAADLYREGEWLFSSELIPPEEAIASHYTTGTRSLCRSSSSDDTNSQEDWHTVPTGEKSFGRANTDETYVVPP
ncbi:MAG: Ig-like domain-containing protein [Spirochaetales bacterium]|nr:Ig-like domain-containing protein [Spirochaetales bacterium]